MCKKKSILIIFQVLKIVTNKLLIFPGTKRCSLHGQQLAEEGSTSSIRGQGQEDKEDQEELAGDREAETEEGERGAAGDQPTAEDRYRGAVEEGAGTTRFGVIPY